jgi:hypothetical protein
MKLKHALSFGLALSLLWLAMVAYVAREEMTPIYVKKKVTISIHGAASAGFVFSNEQPHNEIIYEMKSEWIPRLEASLEDYRGKVITTPYDTYRDKRIPSMFWKYMAVAVAPLLGLLALLGLVFWR